MFSHAGAETPLCSEFDPQLQQWLLLVLLLRMCCCWLVAAGTNAQQARHAW
jgi:hypothetical protein